MKQSFTQDRPAFFDHFTTQFFSAMQTQRPCPRGAKRRTSDSIGSRVSTRQFSAEMAARRRWTWVRRTTARSLESAKLSAMLMVWPVRLDVHFGLRPPVLVC